MTEISILKIDILIHFIILIIALSIFKVNIYTKFGISLFVKILLVLHTIFSILFIHPIMNHDWFNTILVEIVSLFVLWPCIDFHITNSIARNESIGNKVLDWLNNKKFVKISARLNLLMRIK